MVAKNPNPVGTVADLGYLKQKSGREPQVAVNAREQILRLCSIRILVDQADEFTQVGDVPCRVSDACNCSGAIL